MERLVNILAHLKYFPWQFAESNLLSPDSTNGKLTNDDPNIHYLLYIATIATTTTTTTTAAAASK